MEQGEEQEDVGRVRVWVSRLQEFISSLGGIDGEKPDDFCENACNAWQGIAMSDLPPKRYMVDATNTMMNMLTSFYSRFERGGADAVHDLLMSDKRSRQNWYGPNHWWPVTLSVLAESQEFCDGGFKTLGPDPEL